jgi:hypothetical protein
MPDSQFQCQTPTIRYPDNKLIAGLRSYVSGPALSVTTPVRYRMVCVRVGRILVRKYGDNSKRSFFAGENFPGHDLADFPLGQTKSRDDHIPAPLLIEVISLGVNIAIINYQLGILVYAARPWCPHRDHETCESLLPGRSYRQRT